MTKKAYYDWSAIEDMTQDILQQTRDKQFDAVVGLTRGGLTPAVLVSQYLDIPMHTLKVSLRDHKGIEDMPKPDCNILVIDDINDTGATLNYLQESWGHDTVTYAVLINNEASEADVDYSSVDINKREDDVWIVFPWEDWWK